MMGPLRWRLGGIDDMRRCVPCTFAAIYSEYLGNARLGVGVDVVWLVFLEEEDLVGELGSDGGGGEVGEAWAGEAEKV